MDGFERGVIRRISVEIEYPDGSITATEIPFPAEVSEIAFDESAVIATDLCAFNVSESDWRAKSRVDGPHRFRRRRDPARRTQRQPELISNHLSNR
ncbi:hypothetical protein OG225_34080 [Nocardia sp. NBC_01377]|uniref:hypothetical protein n=1 Tax=Nocardia sp. NBC_01377 TaxID=2903595 RepID=UPI0032493027